LNPIRKWTLIVSGALTITSIILSLFLFYNPHLAIKLVELNTNGLNYPVHMWSTRLFLFGLFLGYATLKKKRPLLTLAYQVFFAISISDFLLGIAKKSHIIVFEGIFLCIISFAMIYYIRKPVI
jgi:hypothetical protein